MNVQAVQRGRALMRRDFFSFASFVASLRGNGNKMSEATFLPVCKWLQGVAERHATRAWFGDPRNHLKTTLQRAWVLWLAFLEPDERYDSPEEVVRARKFMAERPWLKGKQTRIRWVGLNKPIACMQIEAIERLIVEHPLMRVFLPEFHPDEFALSGRKEIWNTEEMALPCSASASSEVFLSAAGVESQSTSLHFDVIVFDDPVNEKTHTHPNEIQTAINWLELATPLLEVGDMTSEEAGLILVIGNFWNYFDVRSYVEEHHPEYDIWHRKCWTCTVCGRERCVRSDACASTDEPLWPERWSRAGLLAEKRLNKVLFAAQYENDPESGDVTEFDAERIRDCVVDWSGKTVIAYANKHNDVAFTAPFARLRGIISVDPASSDDPQSCRSAVGFLAEDTTTGSLLKLDLWAKQEKPEQVVQAIIDMYEKWRKLGVPIVHVGIEGVAGQKYVEPAIRSAAALRGVWQLAYRPMKPRPTDLIQFYKTDAKLKKQDRIAGLIGWRINSGLLYVRADLPERNLFDAETRRFPNAKSTDVLDETAYAEQLCSRNVRKEAECEEIREVLKTKRDKYVGWL